VTTEGHAMNSSLRIASLTSTLALTAGSLCGKAPTETAPAQRLSIRLYDQAQVPNRVLRLATAEADRLFRAARFRIAWDQPSAESAEDRGTDMTSAAFRQADARSYLVVRLMRRTPATVFPGALGYALPFAHMGAHVLIFYDRVEALTQRVNTAGYVILGHALAHEIAHVLLGSSQHATGGLMEARWTPARWRLASAGLLTFRGEEIECIRAGLRRFQSPEPNPEPRTPAGFICCLSIKRSSLDRRPAHPPGNLRPPDLSRGQRTSGFPLRNVRCITAPCSHGEPTMWRVRWGSE
jgi:hypothetical protein